MYLNLLNTEQKEIFLDISLCVSRADKNFSDLEKDMITKLCAEMQIPVRYIVRNDFEDSINRLAEISSERIKRIIILELAGIVMADSVYVEEEKEIMFKVAEKFGLNYKEIENVISMITDLFVIYRKMAFYIEQK